MLWVVADRLGRGSSAKRSERLGGYAYMPLRVQKETVRDDWEGLTAFMEPFDTAIKELAAGHQECPAPATGRPSQR